MIIEAQNFGAKIYESASKETNSSVHCNILIRKHFYRKGHAQPLKALPTFFMAGCEEDYKIALMDGRWKRFLVIFFKN